MQKKKTSSLRKWNWVNTGLTVPSGLTWSTTLQIILKWLLKQGVQLTHVDDYHGTCMFPTFHWWKGVFALAGWCWLG